MNDADTDKNCWCRISIKIMIYVSS